MSNKFKRVLAMLLLLSIVFNLTACGNIVKLNLVDLELTTDNGKGERFTHSENIARALYDSNIITKKRYKSIMSNIENVYDEWLVIESACDSTIEDADYGNIIRDYFNREDFNIIKSISAIRPIYTVDGLEQVVDDEVVDFDFENDVVTSGKNRGAYLYHNDNNGKGDTMASDGSDRCSMLISNMLLHEAYGVDYDSNAIKSSFQSDDSDGGGWLFRDGAVKSGDILPSTLCGVECTDTVFGIKALNKDSRFKWKDINGNDWFSPIKIVSKSTNSSFEEVLDFPLYVLDPNIFEYNTHVENVPLAIEKEIRELKDNIGKVNETKCFEKLDDHFYQPTSTDGKAITLRNIIEESGQSWGSIVTQSDFNESGINGDNLDLVITQGSNHVPILMCRVQEFDVEQCAIINAAIGIFNASEDNSDYMKYFVYRNDKGDSRIYLLEYPIFAIKSLKVTSTEQDFYDDNGEYKTDSYGIIPEFGYAGIGYNIMSGDIIKYDVNSYGDVLSSGVVLSDGDKYLTSTVTLMSDQENTSFKGLGFADVPLGLPATVKDDSIIEGFEFRLKDNTKYRAFIPRIILRDYLESTYAPGYTDDSDCVIFGRKIRFSIEPFVEYDNNEKLSYQKGGELREITQKTVVFDRYNFVATYVDKNGALLKQSLQISDFCDLNDLLEDETVTSIAKYGSDPAIVEAVPDDEITSNEKDITDLKHIATLTVGDKVECTQMFPGPKLGKEDWEADIGASGYSTGNTGYELRQRFWTIGVKTGIFKSGLYATWINSPSSEASLLWWNDYLTENHFIYQVDLDSVYEYLLHSYSTQMQAEGAVLLDLRVVSQLKDLYIQEANEERVDTIRTTFVVVGWALVAFSFILLVIWAADTNTDLGLNLLSKVTFGHWVAIKYDTDLPTDKTTGVSYMTGGRMIIRCLIIIAVGILLINFNVFDFVSYLVEHFGTAATEIEKVITGK